MYMNRKYLWIPLLLLMIPLTSLSQVTLRKDSLSYSCYTPIENRIIGLTILEKLQQDTIIVLYKSKIETLDSINILQKRNINIQDTVILKQNAIIKKQENTFQKMKYYKYSTFGLIGIVVLILAL